ncbi:MAG: tyrosine protein phosphatase [Actinobacteria bacterium]|nr:tyrosine protein phosphatase [Actinomycetota bacterium]
MIDIHCHLLPGIDDGPGVVADAIAMAQAAVEAGITTTICTPHMIAQYPNLPEDVVSGVDAFRAELASAGVELEIVPGGEISMDWLPRMSDDAVRAATLGGNGRWILLEVPFRGWPIHLPAMLTDLEIRGFGVVLAHPERNSSVQASPDRMREIVGRGALVQLTASSFTGDHGPRARQAAEALLRNGMAHFLASDAHSATWRPPELLPGLEAAADAIDSTSDALRWMVDDGPRALLAGGAIRPPRLGLRR